MDADYCTSCHCTACTSKLLNPVQNNHNRVHWAVCTPFLPDCTLRRWPCTKSMYGFSVNTSCTWSWSCTAQMYRRFANCIMYPVSRLCTEQEAPVQQVKLYLLYLYNWSRVCTVEKLVQLAILGNVLYLHFQGCTVQFPCTILLLPLYSFIKTNVLESSLKLMYKTMYQTNVPVVLLLTIMYY